MRWGHGVARGAAGRLTRLRLHLAPQTASTMYGCMRSCAQAASRAGGVQITLWVYILHHILEARQTSTPWIQITRPICFWSRFSCAIDFPSAGVPESETFRNKTSLKFSVTQASRKEAQGRPVRPQLWVAFATPKGGSNECALGGHTPREGPDAWKHRRELCGRLVEHTVPANGGTPFFYRKYISYFGACSQGRCRLR